MQVMDFIFRDALGLRERLRKACYLFYKMEKCTFQLLRPSSRKEILDALNRYGEIDLHRHYNKLFDLPPLRADANSQNIQPILPMPPRYFPVLVICWMY